MAGSRFLAPSGRLSLSFALLALCAVPFVAATVLPSAAIAREPALGSGANGGDDANVTLAALSKWMSRFPAPEVQTPAALGFVSFPISAKSQLTQAYFTQFVACTHDFWDFEALRNAYAAAWREPDCPMCWWAVQQAALWNVGFSTAAREAWEKANELAAAPHSAATDRERRWIASSEHPGNETEFQARMLDLIHAYPDDVDAKLLLAIKVIFGTQTSKLHPLPARELGQRLVEEALADGEQRSRAAALHYKIHAWEDTPTPQVAVEAASLLTPLAYNSTHMAHMPGHIFYITGQYFLGREHFQHARGVDLAYMQDTGISPLNNWEYTHNLCFLAANLAEQGSLKAALEISQEVIERVVPVVADPTRFAPDAAPLSVDPGLSFFASIFFYQGVVSKPYTYFRFGMWKEAAAACAEVLRLALNPSRNSGVAQALQYFRGLGLFAAGMLAAELGDSGAADRDLGALVAVHASLQNSTAHSIDARLCWRVAALEASVAELDGMVHALSGDVEGTVARLLYADGLASALNYDEMSFYPRMPAHSLGTYLLARAADVSRSLGDRRALALRAIAPFERVLGYYPRSGFAYEGLARVFATLAALDERAAASGGGRAAVPSAQAQAQACGNYELMLEAWRLADADLPQVVEAKAYVQEHCS